MVISGRMVQSNTHRAEANVDRDVSRSKRDLLLVVPLSVGEFCMSDAAGGGPYRMPDVVVVRLLLLLILSDGGKVSPNGNEPPSITALGLIPSLSPIIFRSSPSVRLLSRVLVRNDVDVVVLRRYASWPPLSVLDAEGKDTNASTCWMRAEEVRTEPSAHNRASLLIVIGCLIMLLLWAEFEEHIFLLAEERR